jgi:hypothetical protein
MGSRTPSSVPGVFLWKLRWNSWENDRDNSRSVPCQEMVACLRGSELAHRWKHAKGIACEHDDVARLAVDDARDFGVRDVVNRIGTASVLGDANIIVVWYTRKRVVDDILEDTVTKIVHHVTYILLSTYFLTVKTKCTHFVISGSLYSVYPSPPC